ALDVVERVRAIVVPRQLDLAPDLLVGRLLADPGDLPLQAIELAGDPRAAEERKVPQATEPLAQSELVLSRGHRTASAGGPGWDEAPAAGRWRRSGRSADSARPGRSRRAASRA